MNGVVAGARGRLSEAAAFFSKVLNVTIYISQIFLTTLFAMFLVAWTFTPVRDFLIARRIVADKADVTSDAVAVTIFLLLSVLLSVRKTVAKLVREVQLLTPQFDDIIDRGIGAIYPHLEKSIEQAENEHERQLEILGLTLYTAWPHIRDWIQGDELRKWSINLYCVDPGYIKANASDFPIQWLHHAETQIEDIDLFKAEQAQLLQDASIRIELHKYCNFPGLHGFRLGSGEIYFSSIQWEHASGKLTDPYAFYERIRPNDRSRRAHMYRRLFDNWISKAGSTSVKPHP